MAKVKTRVCLECGLPVPEKSFIQHLQSMHEMFVEDYEKKYKSKEKNDEALNDLDIVEEEEKVEAPKVDVSLGFYESLSDREKQIYNDRKKHLVEAYRLDDTQLLEQILFLMIVNERLQAKYMQDTSASEIDKDLLERVTRNQSTISRLLKQFLEIKEKREQAEQVASLHQKAMERAKEFIKANIGMFTFPCKKCGSIVDSRGLPHWAICVEKKSPVGEDKIYYTWSKELWFLFEQGVIPFYVIPFVLQTSPEGIIETAKARQVTGEFVSKVAREHEDSNDEFSATLKEQEDILKELRLKFFEIVDAERKAMIPLS